VLVADDGSTDGTPEVVRRSPVARLVGGAPGGGAYAARNRALAEARGALIAVTDADCRPDPGWLSALATALGEADLVAGRIVVEVSGTPRLAELVDASRHLDQRAYVEQGFAAFANFGCRREVLEAVGPFNARLRSNGDREFCMRATAAGFRLAYAPGAVVRHDALRSVPAVARRCFRMGVGRARTAAVGTGPARAARRNWLGAAAYLPALVRGGEPFGAQRLRECGVELDGRALRRVELASYPLVGVPLLAGLLAGTVTRARRGSR
jgi:glycosyltransferase involved in cell wall biosynthesis